MNILFQFNIILNHSYPVVFALSPNFSLCPLSLCPPSHTRLSCNTLKTINHPHVLWEELHAEGIQHTYLFCNCLIKHMIKFNNSDSLFALDHANTMFSTGYANTG